MSRRIASINDFLRNSFIEEVRQSTCTMEKIIENERRFQLYPRALYATDVNFYHANRPQGNQLECKLYYSCKNPRYRYKVEVTVSLLGFAVHVSPHYPGSKADITIFRREMEKHKRYTKKYIDSAALNIIVQPKNGSQ